MSELLDKVLDLVATTVEECGGTGCPGGILYAGMMNVGVTLEQFEAIMARLVRDGRVTKRGQVYYGRKA